MPAAVSLTRVSQHWLRTFLCPCIRCETNLNFLFVAASPVEYVISTPNEATTKTGHKLLPEAAAAAATTTARAAAAANETAGAYLTKSSQSDADNGGHGNNNNSSYNNKNNYNSSVPIQLPAAANASASATMSLPTYAPLHNKKHESK